MRKATAIFIIFGGMIWFMYSIIDLSEEYRKERAAKAKHYLDSIADQDRQDSINAAAICRYFKNEDSEVNKRIESGKYKYSGKLQDAGDFDRELDTAIQRKMKNTKFETDKYCR